MLTITHHGAVTGVTGSCHELSLHGPGGAKAGVLVDCGIFQGDAAAGRSGADALAIDFPVAHLRALVVTHVHIDHVGRIPHLPAEIRIVHGEDEAKAALKRRLKEAGAGRVLVPGRQEGSFGGTNFFDNQASKH